MGGRARPRTTPEERTAHNAWRVRLRENSTPEEYAKWLAEKAKRRREYRANLKVSDPEKYAAQLERARVTHRTRRDAMTPEERERERVRESEYQARYRKLGPATSELDQWLS